MATSTLLGHSLLQPLQLRQRSITSFISACQICWYAGLSNKLSSIGFYEYNPLEDSKGQTASVIATMIWYLVE
ncbi:MAG TPA: hypothetical protein VK907_04965, partial [Phnomibacter sp.]|nr:hypothetical protein [Phnomibacter sp.]